MANLYNVPTQNSIQRVLANTLTSGETSTITFSVSVSSVLQASADIPGILVIDRIDSNGNLTPTNVEYISFTGVSGSTVTGLTRGLAGTTAKGHSIGAVVEFVPDVTWADALNDVITTQHNADGTHKTLSNLSLVSVTINNGTGNFSNVSITNGLLTNVSLASSTLISPTISGKTLLPATYKTLVSYSDASTINLDLSQGNIFTGTITAGRTFTVSNPSDGQPFMVRVLSSGGAYTPSWFSTIYWAGGTAPALTSGKVTVFGFLCTASGYYDGYLVGSNL